MPCFIVAILHCQKKSTRLFTKFIRLKCSVITSSDTRRHKTVAVSLALLVSLALHVAVFVLGVYNRITVEEYRMRQAYKFPVKPMHSIDIDPYWKYCMLLHVFQC